MAFVVSALVWCAGRERRPSRQLQKSDSRNKERGKKSVGGLQRGGGLLARLGGGERDPRRDCQSPQHLRHLLLSGGARRACRRRSRRRRPNSSRTRPRPGGCSPERGSTPTTASRWCARTRPSSSRRPSPGRCSSRPPPCSSTTRETISWLFLIQIPESCDHGSYIWTSFTLILCSKICFFLPSLPPHLSIQDPLFRGLGPPFFVCLA